MSSNRGERKILITAGSVELEAWLNGTETGGAVWDQLPISAAASTWGEEIYFAIPVSAELENGREVVDRGDLGYWPPGNAFCIFFGKTPASIGDEIRPASPVTVIGRIEGDTAALKGVAVGSSVTIQRA